jgi:hypothetical protein
MISIKAHRRITRIIRAMDRNKPGSCALNHQFLMRVSRAQRIEDQVHKRGG